MLTFETYTGSTYQIEDTPAGGFVRRVNSDQKKRGDERWVRLHNNPIVEVGSSVFLVLDSLKEEGPDDHGNVVGDEDERFTYRTTSYVTRITTHYDFEEGNAWEIL